MAFEKKHWKHNRINQLQFKDIVDTGDILLFQSKAVASKMQRMITRSKYDHIALILRYSNGKLVIFESLRDTGVSVCDWDRFMRMKWFNLYNKVEFRKLYYPRSQKFIDVLEDFVKQSIGKKFKINPTKIFRKKCSNDTALTIKGEKTYFCSELVACAYKRLGILDQEIAASQYWPGDFSAEDHSKQVKLLDGARLSEEYLMEFV